MRVTWSNIHNKNNIAKYDVNESILTPNALKQLSTKLYDNFKYTYDSVDELFDSMIFPAQCYYDLTHGTLYDDCDGYHAAMYHIADANNYDCCLLTYMTNNWVDSHTVLVLKHNESYYKLDYKTLTKRSSIKELIDGIDVLDFNLVKFNYTYNVYYIINKEDF